VQPSRRIFYKLCNDFHNNNLCMRSINSSLITFIPKIDGARTVLDYRPISLLNSSVRLLTKLLANRLQTVITKLVHRSQYSFIKKRTTQDCLARSPEYLHLCHNSKKEIVILKMDFKKAFDKMEYQAMLTIMEKKRLWIEVATMDEPKIFFSNLSSTPKWDT